MAIVLILVSLELEDDAVCGRGRRSLSTPPGPPGSAGVPPASKKERARRTRSQGVGGGGGAYSTLPARQIRFVQKKCAGLIVLFRNGRHLDGVSFRHQGETQGGSSSIDARRDAVKVECKPVPTGGRPGNRLWQRQRPVGGWSLSEQVERSRRRGCDFYANARVGASRLPAHRRDAKGYGLADAGLLGRLRFRRLEPRIVTGGRRCELQDGRAFCRNAKPFADRIVEGEAQRRRPVRAFRDDMDREDHTALVSDRGAAIVRETMGRRPQDREGLDVLGFGEVKHGRHATITRVPPISLPSGREPDLDACPQRAVCAERATGDEPHRRT